MKYDPNGLVASVYYLWDRYLLTSYDEIIKRIEDESHKSIEPIQKILITEAEYKVVATFYHVRSTIDSNPNNP